MNEIRWIALMEALGMPSSKRMYNDLRQAYREKHRHYHTEKHIADCLSKFDSTKFLAINEAEVETAIWFHDAIYKPYSNNDSLLLADIDLSILGAEKKAYESFEISVRKEYRWIPYFIYRKKRRAILTSFLDRDTIYSNEYFQKEYEMKARGNIRDSIAALGK
jgi:predicted metal-dependent HD superfamily phosphohydrolase